MIGECETRNWLRWESLFAWIQEHCLIPSFLVSFSCSHFYLMWHQMCNVRWWKSHFFPDGFINRATEQLQQWLDFFNLEILKWKPNTRVKEPASMYLREVTLNGGRTKAEKVVARESMFEHLKKISHCCKEATCFPTAR